MRTQTRQHYAEIIEDVLRDVLSDLDQSLDPRSMADRAMVSVFHFSRMFSGMVGESPAELVRRVRLERAAHRLRFTQAPITELAFEASFDSLEAFTRAFRAAYQMTPSEYRRRSLGWTLPASCGVHFGLPFAFRPRQSGGCPMQVMIRSDVPAQRVAALRHVGAYWQIGEAFDRLWAWVRENEIPVVGPSLAIYHDDPGTTPEKELRSDACVPIPADLTLDDPLITAVTLPGGKYAVATHEGAYESLGATWNQFMGEWFPGSGETIDESRPCYELYVIECGPDVAPADLRTQLYEAIH